MDMIQVKLHKIHTREHLKTDYSVHKDEAKRYLAKNVNKCSNSKYSRKMVMLRQQQQGKLRVVVSNKITQAHNKIDNVAASQKKKEQRPSTAK